jgi:hypothetical protein
VRHYESDVSELGDKPVFMRGQPRLGHWRHVFFTQAGVVSVR